MSGNILLVKMLNKQQLIALSDALRILHDGLWIVWSAIDIVLAVALEYVLIDHVFGPKIWRTTQVFDHL